MLQASTPATGELRPSRFREAGPEEIDQAAALAARAGAALAGLPPRALSHLLRALAGELRRCAEELVALAEGETSLGLERLRGELVRTCSQLSLFAAGAGSGHYLEPVIRTAAGGAPDLRRLQTPLGLIAVFPAANFPLAFGVLGTDVASALAAGCPVAVKAHPGHPETSAALAQLAGRVLRGERLPEAALTLLQGASPAVGEALVDHPLVQGVSFTGSLAVGSALYRRGAERSSPIPVFAEMGSVNPVFVTEGVTREQPGAFARGLFESVNLGNGQFCTKPGLVFCPSGASADLVALLREMVTASRPRPMLSRRMAKAYAAGTLGLREWADLGTPGAGTPGGEAGFSVGPAIASTSWSRVRGHAQLWDEIFGPVAIVVACDGIEEFEEAARCMPGSLTATIHCLPGEVRGVAGLARAVAARAGRVIWRGFPTGVTVADAMQHGGPYPASTQPWATSVGDFAVRRWQRPVCYQNWPDQLLPKALQSANPLRLRRLLDGHWTRQPDRRGQA